MDLYTSWPVDDADPLHQALREQGASSAEIPAVLRGVGLGAGECEIACPASPVQLTLARLAVVLGYDVALGLCLSVVGWLRAMHAGASFLAVTLHWSMPLLLVAGLALVLS